MEILERLQILEDKQAIINLTNSYLEAADKKDHESMAAHFSFDGKIKSIMASGTIDLVGKQGIAEGFKKILAPITTAYHMAGQLQIVLNGQEATGTSHSFVTLVNEFYVHKIWAIYNDQYAKEDGKWFIKSRVATTAWEEKNSVN